MARSKTAPRERGRERARLHDPLGPRELAQFLGVKRATVQQWSFRNVLPERDYTINNFPAWERSTIVQWAVDTGRLDPDDPRAEGYEGEG